MTLFESTLQDLTWFWLNIKAKFSLAARCAFENVPVRKGDLQTLISKVENPLFSAQISSFFFFSLLEWYWLSAYYTDVVCVLKEEHAPMINGAAPAARESILVAALLRTNVSLWTLRSGFVLFFFIYLRQSCEGIYSPLRSSKKRLKGHNRRWHLHASKLCSAKNSTRVVFGCCVLSQLLLWFTWDVFHVVAESLPSDDFPGKAVSIT